MTLLRMLTERLCNLNSQRNINSVTTASRMPQICVGAVVLISGLVMTAGCAYASDTPDTRHVIWYEDESWIRDVGVLLSRDDDRDGYFTGLVLTMDADSASYREHVYVTIDLIDAEQNPDPLHTSGDFTIYRNNLSNEYRVEIDLVSNYASGRYDLQIGLRDAGNSALLDIVGAAEFSNLRQLPLESEDLDVTAFTDPDIPANDSRPAANEDIRVTEYTGSSSWMMIIMLAIVFIASRQRLHTA